jgi:hypothetical protein
MNFVPIQNAIHEIVGCKNNKETQEAILTEIESKNGISIVTHTPDGLSDIIYGNLLPLYVSSDIKYPESVVLDVEIADVDGRVNPMDYVDDELE